MRNEQGERASFAFLVSLTLLVLTFLLFFSSLLLTSSESTLSLSLSSVGWPRRAGSSMTSPSFSLLFWSFFTLSPSLRSILSRSSPSRLLSQPCRFEFAISSYFFLPVASIAFQSAPSSDMLIWLFTSRCLSLFAVVFDNQRKSWFSAYFSRALIGHARAQSVPLRQSVWPRKNYETPPPQLTFDEFLVPIEGLALSPFPFLLASFLVVVLLSLSIHLSTT